MKPSTTEVQRIISALTGVLQMPSDSLSHELGVSSFTIESWLTGAASPGLDQALALRRLAGRQIASLEPKSSTLRKIIALLELRYGSPRLVNLEDPLDELFFNLVSLKTPHRAYAQVYEHFRLKFHPWSNLLDATKEDVEAHIKKSGLGSIKAAAFIDIARRLYNDLGEVSLSALKNWPNRKAEKYLTSLPAVGLKSARWVLLHSFHRDVLPVDSHTYRVGVRLGVIPASVSVNSLHLSFDKVVPPGLAYALHTNFVALGTDLCLDPTPTCARCALKDLCQYYLTRTKESETVTPVAAMTVRDVLQGSEPTNNGGVVAVDVYAGCGGLSSGLHDAGINVAYALDWDVNACKTYQHNFPNSIVENIDVRMVTGDRILATVGSTVDLVAGGPNCQGVSERGLRSPDDPRNFMFAEFVRLVAELKPRAFLMENVPGIAHRHNFEMLRAIFRSFESLGYKCAGDVLLAADYGVPQLRYRFFLIGTQDDINLTLPESTHRAAPSLLSLPYVSVREAISDLPEISAHQQKDIPLQYANEPTCAFQSYAREGSSQVHNHFCSATEPINLRRALHVPEGGNWKDIPPELLSDRFFTCRMTDHSTTYARLRWDQPSFTITALFGNITAGAFTHPAQNRALSIREGARLQSFRDRFIFQGPRNSQYRQIGNAVPPLLARAVGQHLVDLLKGREVTGRLPRITPEVLRDKESWGRLPVLTPRFRALFGSGTRWPKGWGPEPIDYSTMLDTNYSLRREFWPTHLQEKFRKPSLH